MENMHGSERLFSILKATGKNYDLVKIKKAVEYMDNNTSLNNKSLFF